MEQSQNPTRKWWYLAWAILTLVYILLRFQNISGVFLPNEIVIDDTDPYYRLHRILTMLQQQKFYPLHDTHLSYPNGIHVPWPLGLDILIALPLYLYHATSQIQVETFAAIVIPFLSLPTLWCSGAIGTLLVNRVFGFLLGMMVAFGQTVIVQSELGRIDHHFMETMFPVALLMFFIKFKEWHHRYDLLWIIGLLSLAPSFCPQGWILGPFLLAGIVGLREWGNLRTFAKVFLFSGLLSILPLSFSDRFEQGYFYWISFSWWTPWIYLSMSFGLFLAALCRERKLHDRLCQAVSFVSFVAVTSFVVFKNSADFLYQTIRSQIDVVVANAGTMSTTVEARTPFEVPESVWMHGDIYLLILGSLCFLYFLFLRRYLFILGYAILPIALTFFQVRFYAYSYFFCALILLLFFQDLIQKLQAQPKIKTAAMCLVTAMLIIPFRPAFGLRNYQNNHGYYEAVKGFTTFLNSEFKRLERKKEDQSILAHWDYGHWLLYYTDLPVVADPFQGDSAYDVIGLFTSQGTDEFGPFLAKHPASYLLIESGASRSYQWINTVGKDSSKYFEKAFESSSRDYFKTTDAFHDLFMFRYFFELGRDLNNQHPQDWRLVYISDFGNPTDLSLPALKVFEHVAGAQIHVSTRNNSEELYLQADILEKGEATVFQQTAKGIHDFTWTVPYGEYERGNVKFDGIYTIRDPEGNILYKTPPVSEAEVLRGDRIDVFF